MALYIAFFRGINVGGKNKVKMAELKRLFEAMGLADAETFLQSGNVLFRSVENACELQIRIERAFEEKFGFNTSAVLRTLAELSELIRISAVSFVPQTASMGIFILAYSGRLSSLTRLRSHAHTARA